MTFTTAKYKANLYQKRMMLAVVSAAQSKIDGVRHIAGQRFKIEEGEFPIILQFPTFDFDTPGR